MTLQVVGDQPAVADVLSVVYRHDPPNPLVAVAHLMTPVDVVPGVQVRVVEGHLCWRGERVAVPGGDLSSTVATVARLVATARVPGDVFLDLSAPAGTWLKPVRTGAFVHLFGSREVFAGPAVTVDPRLPGEVVTRLCEAAALGLLPGAGEALVAGTAVTIVRSGLTLHARPR